MHIPALVHDVDLQIQSNVGSLKAASKPLHTVHTVALMHYVQLLLHAELNIQLFFLISNYFLTQKQFLFI
jgi:hypothetical protein